MFYYCIHHVCHVMYSRRVFMNHSFIQKHSQKQLFWETQKCLHDENINENTSPPENNSGHVFTTVFIMYDASCIHHVSTTWSISISSKMKTVHSLTRNVQIIAQSWINIWYGVSWLQWRLPLFVALIHRGNWGITGWYVSRPWAWTFAISDLNKLTS